MSSQQQVEEVATTIVEQEMQNMQGTSSTRAESRLSNHAYIPYSTVMKTLHQMLQFYPYKISSVQELFPGDTAIRLDFPLIFFARMRVDATWSWRILWIDEAHFNLNGVQEPFHSPKLIVWCGFTGSCVIGPYVYGKTEQVDQ